MRKKHIISLLLVSGIVLLDRILKVYILESFTLGEIRPLIPGLIQLTYAQNTGMAFSFLANHPWVPLILTPIFLLILTMLIIRDKFPCIVQRFAMVSIIAGGLANWADRILYGFVVDMFEFTFVRFAVFNIADIFITVGGLVFIVAYIISEICKDRAKKAALSDE